MIHTTLCVCVKISHGLQMTKVEFIKAWTELLKQKMCSMNNNITQEVDMYSHTYFQLFSKHNDLETYSCTHVVLEYKPSAIHYAFCCSVAVAFLVVTVISVLTN